MSVIVKGMEMPQGNSTINVLIYADGTVYTGHVNDSQYSAVSVPTPHGRLIDIKSVEDGKFATVCNDYQRWWNGALESVIDNAPTVIEAEGSEA